MTDAEREEMKLLAALYEGLPEVVDTLWFADDQMQDIEGEPARGARKQLKKMAEAFDQQMKSKDYSRMLELQKLAFADATQKQERQFQVERAAAKANWPKK